ncbi:MAG: hypothetical protein MUC97_02110 [Bernardetiaceae bacterium]|jgi:hypothetical protein|nr:hypothetical protein [Bernardetiaceae bacterium]
MEYYKSPFLHITGLPQANGLLFTWSKETSTHDMTSLIFRREILKQAEIIDLTKPKNLLANAKDLGFGIGETDQAWVNEEIFPRFFKAGVRKFAVLIPEELVAHLSVEQTFEDNKATAITSKFFSDEQAAIAWLNA